MHIVEHTALRLVLQQRRAGMALVMSLFSLMSAFTLLNVLVEGSQRWRLFGGWQWISWLIWLMFLALLLTVGVLVAFSMWHGVTCTFDREGETVTIRRARFLRATQQILPIYSVSHLALEQNPEVRVFGIFLVLRSGERIALATTPLHDEEMLRSHTRTVKDFLLRR